MFDTTQLVARFGQERVNQMLNALRSSRLGYYVGAEIHGLGLSAAIKADMKDAKLVDANYNLTEFGCRISCALRS